MNKIKFHNPHSFTSIGLMSGTSCDGVSAVLCKLKLSDNQLKAKIIKYKTFPYEKEFTQKLLRLSYLKTSELSELNYQLGEKLADAANKMKTYAKSVDFISSHGHTAYHNPPRDEGDRNSRIQASTLQIGEPSIIAQRTGILTVADFRHKDIACGGQGAPLVPLVDFLLFHKKNKIRIALNIGGISNITVVTPKSEDIIAFDTGPGNVLINLALQKLTGGRLNYDFNGRIAAKGRIIYEIIKNLLKIDFFKNPPPKSTGHLEFGKHLVEKILRRYKNYKIHDIISTITYFTALTVCIGVQNFVSVRYKIDELVISGGGAFNKTLVSFIKNLFHPIPVYTIDKYKIHPLAKEPLCFAVLGLLTLLGKPNNLPSATGASSKTILGKIILP